MIRSVPPEHAAPPLEGGALRDHAAAFLAQRVALMFTTARSASALAAAAVVVSFAVLALEGTSPWLWLWLVAVLVTNGGRFWLFRAYRRDPVARSLDAWQRAHMLTGVATGVAWGLLPLHPGAGLPPAYQALLLLIPSLIATGAINAYGVILAQYRVFLIALFTSLVASHLWRNGLGVWPTEIVFIFVGAGLMRMAHHFQHRLINAMDAQVQLEVANVTLATANDLLAREQENTRQERALATHVYRQLVSGAEMEIPGVHTWSRSVGHFCGDLTLVTRSADGRIYLMLGDFTGHGLPAALGAVPATGVFLPMAQKGLALEDIARELDTRLSDLLPVGYFCCAVLATYEPRDGTLALWNGGMPPVMIRRGDSGRVDEYGSDHLPLAVLRDDAPFEARITRARLSAQDCLLAFSDGLIERTDAQGHPWGVDRLRQVLTDATVPGQRLESVRAELEQFAGRDAAQDDISVVELCPAALVGCARRTQAVADPAPDPV